MGLLLIVWLLSRELSVYMRENLTFSIVLKDEAKESDIIQMQNQLNKLPYIKSTQYISKEMAAKEMIAELGEDPSIFLGVNPFQAKIELKLKSDYTHTDSLRMVERKLTSYPYVSEWFYPKDVMQLVNENIARIGLALSGLIIILLLISFTLINNTVRLLIYSKRFLIYTMRLVGATSGFIRRPFIKYNFISGFFAGLLAIFMLMGALYYLKKELMGLDQIISTDKVWLIYGIVLIAGVLLSSVAACMAVNRYLQMERGKMYNI
jgi:cell division transport system permease protein